MMGINKMSYSTNSRENVIRYKRSKTTGWVKQAGEQEGKKHKRERERAREYEIQAECNVYIEWHRQIVVSQQGRERRRDILSPHAGAEACHGRRVLCVCPSSNDAPAGNGQRHDKPRTTKQGELPRLTRSKTTTSSSAARPSAR